MRIKTHSTNVFYLTIRSEQVRTSELSVALDDNLMRTLSSQSWAGCIPIPVYFAPPVRQVWIIQGLRLLVLTGWSWLAVTLLVLSRHSYSWLHQAVLRALASAQQLTSPSQLFSSHRRPLLVFVSHKETRSDKYNIAYLLVIGLYSADFSPLSFNLLFFAGLGLSCLT